MTASGRLLLHPVLLLVCDILSMGGDIVRQVHLL